MRVQREGDEALVRVSDSGLGIPTDALPHVFDRFSQVRAHQGQAEGGLGIGLSLVRSLTEMHGGQVNAESHGSGTGSTFTVRLPLSRTVASQPESTAATEAGPAGGGLRVLVADDNDDAAATLAMLIEAQGHQVEIAHDGLEAVQKAQEFAPDVAFLDIGMPRMNGLDAARRLRELRDATPMVVVAVTGWGQPKDRQRTLDAGFDAHLVKPPKLNELTEVLAEARNAPSRGVKMITEDPALTVVQAQSFVRDARVDLGRLQAALVTAREDVAQARLQLVKAKEALAQAKSAVASGQK